MAIQRISETFRESADTKYLIAESPKVISSLFQAVELLYSVLSKGSKIMFCGNGGSAADAQHLTAELLIRLRKDVNRKGIPCLSLCQDTSTITACGNDIGFEDIFARVLETLGEEGDVLFALSTSGDSKNIIKAMKSAKNLGIKIIGFLGSNGGKAKHLCDIAFLVPSSNTARIQESHITAGHIVLELLEDKLLESKKVERIDRY